MKPVADRSSGTRTNGDVRAQIIRGAAEVLAHTPYSEAKFKELAAASGLGVMSARLCFKDKKSVASALLDDQQARMKAVLDNTKHSTGNSLHRLLTTIGGLGLLVSQDRVVQAGIHLALQPGTGLERSVRSPYAEWVLVADELIAAGILDGSVRPEVQVSAMAETLNEIFVGAQVLAGLEGQWSTLPLRLSRTLPMIEALLKNPAAASRVADGEA